jgi:hypothetical protein
MTPSAWLVSIGEEIFPHISDAVAGVMLGEWVEYVRLSYSRNLKTENNLKSGSLGHHATEPGWKMATEAVVERGRVRL